MKKEFILISCLTLLLMSCKTTNYNKHKEISSFYIGTMPSKEAPTSEGIYQSSIDSDGKFGEVTLIAKTDSPTFLTKTENQKYLIATNSTSQGALKSYKIDSKNITEISSTTTDAGPCYVNTQNGFVLSANYSSGSINLFKIDDYGNLSSLLDRQKHQISTPSKHNRQKKPFAHSCYFEPSSNNIIAIDLGANKLLFSHIKNNHLVPNVFSELEMPANSGPRHLAFHPKKAILYVVNELSATVTVIQKNTKNNTYQIVETIPTLPANFKGQNTAAHILISQDAQFLYMTNRGHDSITVFHIKEDGTLEFVEQVGVHGEHPRNFTLSPDNRFLIVANRDTNNLVSFQRNTKTGKLTYIEQIKTPRPVYLLF